MKKLLYGSTALIAAGMLASSAGAAERVKMGITGYFQAFGIYVDEDDGVGEPGANRREHSIEREGEIIFNGKTTLDNGIEVGVQVQLEAETCGDQIDESFIWFEGGFGRINIGSENSAAYLMHYASPTASGSFAFGLNEMNFRGYQPGTHVSGPAGTTVTNPVLLSSDSEKITYFTPRIAGFQLGVSYTPDNCEENGGASAPGAVACGGSYGGTELDNNNTGEVFELSVNFVQKLGDFNVAVSGSWGAADDEVGTLRRTIRSSGRSAPRSAGAASPSAAPIPTPRTSRAPAASTPRITTSASAMRPVLGASASSTRTRRPLSPAQPTTRSTRSRSAAATTWARASACTPACSSGTSTTARAPRRPRTTRRSCSSAPRSPSDRTDERGVGEAGLGPPLFFLRR